MWVLLFPGKNINVNIGGKLKLSQRILIDFVSKLIKQYGNLVDNICCSDFTWQWIKNKTKYKAYVFLKKASISA